jgi:uncharacterized Zn-binding protein involved in type VI secretion
MKKKMQFLLPLAYRHHYTCSQRIDLHDTKRKGRLEHSTRLIDVQRKAVSGKGNATQTPQVKVVVVGAIVAPIGAVRVSDAAQTPHCADEGAHKEEIDEGDEVGRVFGARVQEEGAYCPCGSEHRDDEEDENGGGCEQAAVVVEVNEPGQHAQGWDQSEDLHDAPEHEREAGEGHGGRGRCATAWVGGGGWLRLRRLLSSLLSG